MNLTYSQTAEAILSRNQDFQKNLQQALGGLSGNCFIEGRVGRSAKDDRVVLMCQGREAITVEYYEFGDAATVKRIARQLSSPAPE